MDVLVTGATGFVAGHLIPRLVELGHRVVAAGHDQARLARLEGAETLLWDHRLPPSGLPARVDAVVHLAQSNAPFPDGAADLFAVNVASTQHLLEYARRAGVGRFVFASTGSVYRGGPQPLREDDPTDGRGYYAATKAAAERLVQAYGETGQPAFTIFRLFAPYGPGQTGRMVPGLINRVRTGQEVTLPGGSGPRFNPLYVANVVDVLAQALTAGGAPTATATLSANLTANLGGDEALSIRDMAAAIGRVLGTEPVLRETPAAAVDYVGDTARMRQHFRLPQRLTSFEEGVRLMVESGAGSGR